MVASDGSFEIEMLELLLVSQKSSLSMNFEEVIIIRHPPVIMMTSCLIMRSSRDPPVIMILHRDRPPGERDPEEPVRDLTEIVPRSYRRSEHQVNEILKSLCGILPRSYRDLT